MQSTHIQLETSYTCSRPHHTHAFCHHHTHVVSHTIHMQSVTITHMQLATSHTCSLSPSHTCSWLRHTHAVCHHTHAVGYVTHMHSAMSYATGVGNWQNCCQKLATKMLNFRHILPFLPPALFTADFRRVCFSFNLQAIRLSTIGRRSM